MYDCVVVLGVGGGGNKVATLADLMAADVFELSGWEDGDEEGDETATEETDSKVSWYSEICFSQSSLAKTF